MMDGYYGQGGGGNDLWGFVFMILMMALVVLGIVVLVRYLGNNSNGKQTGETALDLLEKRYANGDIDKKEFEEKRKDLKG